MPRDYYINGETLVRVRFGDQVPSSISNIDCLGGNCTNLSELGLTSESIQITPNYYHRDIHIDDFGREVPAEVMAMLSDCNIQMTLIHYDPDILDVCLSESLGGSALGYAVRTDGTLAPAGSMLGGYKGFLTSGYHFISLNLVPGTNFVGGANEALDWRFPAAYLTGPPMRLPLGTKKSLTVLNWRAIPYPRPQFSITIRPGGSTVTQKELVSSGVILWDHDLDE